MPLDTSTVSASVNYLKSCPYPRPNQALLSIKPEYVKAIFAGEKRFEYRRTVFKRQVDVVVIYVTSPVKRVVGEFDVKRIWSEPIESLWERTSDYAGVDKKTYLEYFSGKEHGYAIEIGEIRAYQVPLILENHFGIRPPQSFLYLDFPWPRCMKNHAA